MGNRTINQLPDAGALANDDILAVVQNFTDSKATLDEISEFVLQDSDYATVIETRTTDYDYSASDLFPDHRIFANPTSANVTLGFFNGSDRDGSLTIVKCVGTANQVNIELATDGVTDYILIPGDVIIFMWDDTNSIWQILSQQSGSIYDYVINNQEDFNFIIDRVAANQYKIADGIRSIYLKNFTSGYQMTGGSSPLSGGDTWGYIETNDCTRIICEPQAFIDMHQERGYIEVNTDYCYINGMSIRGDKGVASAIAQSFLLNANYVTFHNCDSQLRLSNTSFYVFRGSGTTKHNDSSRYIGCKVENCDSNSTGFSAFYTCNNITNAYINNVEFTGAAGTTYLLRYCNYINGLIITNIASATNAVFYIFDNCEYLNNIYTKTADTTNGTLIGYSNCNDISNSYMEDLDATAVTGYNVSFRLANCSVYDLNATAGECYGFAQCKELSNCRADKIDAAGGDGVGFINSFYLSSCYAIDIDSSTNNAMGYNSCKEISSSYAEDVDASGTNNGFENCSDVAGCYSYDNENGFFGCDQVVGCNSVTNSTNGFLNCDQITGCRSASNTNDGFASCTNVSGCRAISNGNDGFSAGRNMTANRSENNTVDGFDGCKTMTANRSVGNGGANYNNSFADLAGLNVCADTANGGYNG